MTVCKDGCENEDCRGGSICMKDDDRPWEEELNIIKKVYSIPDAVITDINILIQETISESLRRAAEKTKKFDANMWLGNVYGLDDDSHLTAGEIQELCEMLVHDVAESIINDNE